MGRPVSHVGCVTEGCERPHCARGYCQRHYDEWRASRPERQADTKRRSQAHYEQNKADYIQRASEWRVANPEPAALSAQKTRRKYSERRMEYDAKWRAENWVLYRQRVRRYQERNRERLLDMQRERRRAHPEKFNAYNATRRARRVGAPGEFSRDEWTELLEQFGYCCAYCGSDGAGNAIEMDHITALSTGGSHCRCNIVPACRSCNAIKHNHSFAVFLVGGGIKGR